MVLDVKVPEAGESVTEGRLLEWHKQTGDYVRADEPLFELETDKITMTVAAEAAGELTVLVPEGTTVKPGQVVARIDTSKEALAAAPEEGAPGVSPLQMESAPSAPPEPAAPGPAPAPRPQRPPTELAEALPPSVRRLAKERGLDVARVTGTGKGGRVTVADIRRELAPEAAPPGDGQPRQTRRPMSALRKTIARRLVQAQKEAAILTTFNEADMSRVLELRARYREAFESRYGVRPGIVSFFVKAVVDALQTVPALNAFIEGEEIVQNHTYDIGVAVATPQGLVVPVLRDCDRKPLPVIEQEIEELARRARERKLELQELEGGSFTISNGGVFGSLLSTPLLNPPQSGVLGLHAIKKRPVAVGEDRIEVRPMMYLALSYDHRLVDGAEAVTFLKRIVTVIEAPERLLLGV